jgi:signal peptidase I
MFKRLLKSFFREPVRGVYKETGFFDYFKSIAKYYVVINYVLGYDFLNYVVANQLIGSGSMVMEEPTYNFTLVSPLAYKFNNIQVGDIVAFTPKWHPGQLYLKLIVAKGPTEEEYKRTGKKTAVRFIGNTLMVNDQLFEMQYDGTYEYVESETRQSGFRFKIKFPHRPEFFSIFLSEQDCNRLGIMNNNNNYTETYELKPGQFFMLGVHMQNSIDSRDTLGIIDESDIYGKAIFTWFSNGALPKIFNPKVFIKNIRWDQVFRHRYNYFKKVDG